MKEIKTQEELNELSSSKMVVVDFYATWCGPCMALSPVLEKISEETENSTIVKVNTEEAPSLAEKYKISAIPAILFIKDGEEVERLVGLQSEANIKSKLETLSE